MRARSTRRSNRGFTLMELMTALAVAGVALGLGVPQLRGFLNRAAIVASSNDLLGDLSLARSEAVTRGARVTVCTSTNGTSCTGSTWSYGRLVFSDAGVVGTIDGADFLIKASSAPDRSVSGTAGGGLPAGGLISYAGTGTASVAGTITVCKTGQQRRTVTLTATGSARTSVGTVCP